VAHRFYEGLRELQALGAERTTDEVIFEHFTLMNHSAKAIELEDIEARLAELEHSRRVLLMTWNLHLDSMPHPNTECCKASARPE
jgi:hypothetical protein